MNKNLHDIDLLDELDNISSVHWLERDTINNIMLDFGARITKVLEIERMSVWIFNNQKDLVSIGEYDSRYKGLKSSSVILKKDFPNYFKYINENKIINVSDVYDNSKTKELTLKYAPENDIISLLDIPLRIEGNIIGVMCFEKTGKIKKSFSKNEKSFALSLSFVFASNLEARYRRATQHKLEKALHEKELLIKEMNHRVRNNFSILISLMRISQNDKISKSPKELLKEYEQRIFSMMKIHDLLCKTESNTSINVTTYFEALIKEFKSTHTELKNKITLTVSKSHIELNSKSVLHIGLILTEIFINSTKHTNHETYNFNVSFDQLNDNNYTLTVSDNGPGFDFDKSLSNGSFGINIIKDLCEVLCFEVSYPSIGNPKYVLSFSSEIS